MAYALVAGLVPPPEPLAEEVAEQVQIEAKYAGYIEKQRAEVARFRRLEDRRLPPGLDYGALAGLRTEAREQLAAVRPATVGQAGRLAGVNPADISVLLVHLKRLAGRGRGVAMSERCPYLGLADNREQAHSQPSPHHRCYAARPPARMGTVYQVSACLRPAYRNCPRLPQETPPAPAPPPERRKLSWAGIPAVLPDDERQAERVHPASTPVPLPSSAPAATDRGRPARRRVTLTEVAVVSMMASIVLAFLFVGYAVVYRLQLAGGIGAPDTVAQAPPARTLVPTFTPTPAPTLTPLPTTAPGETAPPPPPTSEPAPPTPTPPTRPAAVSPPTRLLIPAIEMDIPVLSVGTRTVKVGGQQRAIWDDVPDAGGFHATSAYPGQPGNTVINGHRDIQGSVFRRLNKVEVGDEIVLYVGDVAYPYLVSETLVVPETFASARQRAENLKLIGYMPEERLTLVTCTPVGLATHRLLVIAHPPQAASPGMPKPDRAMGHEPGTPTRICRAIPSML